MADVTIEIDDQGNIGKLPEPLQKFFDKGFNEAFRKGAAKVEQELSGRLADPSATEKLRLLEDENSRYKEAELRRQKEYEEADRLKEERHAAALKDREEKLAAAATAIEQRTTRLKQAIGSDIRAAAIAAGAREESLPELVKLLGADVDLDANLQTVVIGEDKTPRMKDGKPVTVEGLVTDYLAAHPHHLRGGRSTSGRSTHGATFRAGAAPAGAEAAKAELAQSPGLATLTRAIGASRRAGA